MRILISNKNGQSRYKGNNIETTATTKIQSEASIKFKTEHHFNDNNVIQSNVQREHLLSIQGYVFIKIERRTSVQRNQFNSQYQFNSNTCHQMYLS